MDEKELKNETDEEKVKRIQEDVLSNIQVICDKHGIVTQSSIYLRNASFTNVEDTKGIKEHHSFFCLNCIHDYLSRLTEQGELARVRLGVSEKLLNEMHLTPEDMDKIYKQMTRPEVKANDSESGTTGN